MKKVLALLTTEHIQMQQLNKTRDETNFKMKQTARGNKDKIP
jgi:hypothetical protein